MGKEAPSNPPTNRIGSYNESGLHASLKRIFAGEKAVHEAGVGGFIADLVDKGRVIEIQTGGFSKIRGKLAVLLETHRVKLVYPVAREKTIVVYDGKMERELYRRRSPKRGSLADVTDELVYIPKLLTNPRFSLEVVLTREEEIRSADGGGSWRRRGVRIVERTLVEVVGRKEFRRPEDYLELLPEGLPRAFTNRIVAERMRVPVYKARRLTYCLKAIGLLRVTGREGNAHTFEIPRRRRGG